MEKLVCPFCPEMLTSKLNFTRSQYLGHIKKFHSADPNFFITCGFHGCPRTFKSFSYFRNHVYDIHGSGSQATCQTTPLPPVGVMEDDEGEGTVAYEPMEDDCREEHPGAGLQESEDVIGQLKKASALFILGSKERFKLTQVATQGIIEGTTNLMQLYLGALHSEVKKRLASIGVPSTDLHCLDDLFDERSDYMEPFSEVDSHHKQLKFYREHFNLIEPERVVLGEKQSWKGSGATRQLISKKNEFMYIPILKTLESMLQCDDTMAKIEKGHKETRNGILSDFCDGEAFQLSPLFSVHLNALQIFFYFDELEVVNPLGSKTKVHKLSIFYFTLGNIPPKERSKLSAIKLVAIAKHKFVNQYGMDRVLEPFVRDLKLLEKGHHFDVKGKQKLLFGTIAAVSGDNLGSLALGGFKESCSSYRICRQCMATPNPARTQFSESEFVLRDKTSHQQQCLLLNIDPNASKNYGINRDSILNELRYFHVCDGGLVPDIMHDLLEGALQYEVKLMLREMIKVEKIFSLATFNSNLAHLELGCMEAKDRPSEISDATLSSSGHGLKQSASQMSLLGRLLPLVVGRMVYDDHPKWENFLLLMEIVDILFCPMSTRDHVSYLSKRIEYHHLEFVKLYPNNSVIPKMHFIIHMPRIILQYGPLLRHWTTVLIITDSVWSEIMSDQSLY